MAQTTLTLQPSDARLPLITTLGEIVRASDYLSDNGFTKHRGKRTLDEIKALNAAVDKFGADIFSDYVYRKPKAVAMKAPTISSEVSYRREENTIRVVDSLTGATIHVDTCSNGHSVRRCNCSKVQPISWLQDIAESWSLVVR